VKKEPAVTVGMVTALAAAVLGLLVVLGLNIDTQKQAAIVVIVGALFPIVSALITRKHVTPVAKEEVN
jgi:urea transporter